MAFISNYFTGTLPGWARSTVGYTPDLINHITVVRRKVILILITSNTFIFTTHPKSHPKINELEKKQALYLPGCNLQ